MSLLKKVSSHNVSEDLEFQKKILVNFKRRKEKDSYVFLDFLSHPRRENQLMRAER